MCHPASLRINNLTLHKVQEDEEDMFSTYVTGSLHAPSYLGGRLLVLTEIGESRPNSVTTLKAHTNGLVNRTYQNTEASHLAARTDRALFNF